MRWIFTLAVILLGSLLFAQTTEKGLTAANGEYIGFLEFHPSDYATGKHPLIIFLHGVGEKGNGKSQLRNVNCCGIPQYIRGGNKMRFSWNGKTESFVVLSPQLSPKYNAWQPFYTDELIKYAIKNLNIDPDRIFLTGLSMGGGGTWNYASASQTYAEKLAGIAPVVAPCMMSNGCNIARASLPLMAIHVLDDKDAPASCTVNALASINACNPLVTPNLVMYNKGGHYVWVHQAFDTAHQWQNPNMYEFFLAQNRSFAPNKKPVANAGGDVDILKSAQVTLSGGGSADPDGSILRYIWRKVSGPAGGAIASPSSAATAINDLNNKGKYVFELKVVDNRAEWSVDNVTITVGQTVSVPNLAPSADAGGDITIVLPTVSATLSGKNSKDADGSVSVYAWAKKSGPGVTIVSPGASSTAINKLEKGVYVFTLKVTDDKGASGSDDVTVTVKASGTPSTPDPPTIPDPPVTPDPPATPNPPVPPANPSIPTSVNLAPVAKAGSDTTLDRSKNFTALNGSDSKDADGTITAYTWKQVSGPAVAGIAGADKAIAQLSELQSGEYIFELTVTDNLNAEGRDSVKVIFNGFLDNAEKIVAWPNPARSELNLAWVNASRGNTRILVYDSRGVIVGSSNINKTQLGVQLQLNIAALKSGTYFLVVIAEKSGKRMLKPFVKLP